MKCTVCKQDLSLPERLFGVEETHAMHAAAHKRHYLSEVVGRLIELRDQFAAEAKTGIRPYQKGKAEAYADAVRLLTEIPTVEFK